MPTPMPNRSIAPSHLLAAASLGAAAVVALVGVAALAASGGSGAPGFTDPASGWRTASTWDDGRAEYATYASTRVIYGRQREYETVMIVATQHMDPDTTTKAVEWQAPDTVPVFKFNVREVVPTENYDYKFLTTAFVRRDDLSPFKLAMSSQEDCGTTYKRLALETGSGDLVGQQFVYFPGAGPRDVRIAGPDLPPLADALPVVLRSFPFAAAEAGDAPRRYRTRLVPDQTAARTTSMTPIPVEIGFGGRETVDVPMGSIEAYRIDVTPEARGSGPLMRFWFAAEGDDPWLHLLVRYEDSMGQTP